MLILLRLAMVSTLLALAACESLGIDPVTSIGSGLKNACRQNDSCTVHEPDPGRRL